MISDLRFSLLMAVYDGDDPLFLKEALQSVLDNTILPSEILLVIDGPVNNKLSDVIQNFLSLLPIKLLSLERNEGLGKALNKGLLACSHDWIARFDSDDICMPDRFEKQIQFIERNANIDAFSAPIIEFEKELTEGPFVIRDVPRGSSELAKYAKWRNPFNHMSVMFRKDSVLKAGNYQDDPSFEDYSLWVRMIMDGSHLDNMEEAVVYARVGTAIQNRRGGLPYVKREIKMLSKMRSWGFISYPEFLSMVFLKSIIRILPSKLRLVFYNNFIRKRLDH